MKLHVNNVLQTDNDEEYLKTHFTEEEIKEAFNKLDYDKDNCISYKDLQYWLDDKDFIGDKATDEEIDEMIRMCDVDGNGNV